MKPIIDVVILSWAKDNKLKEMTEYCIRTLFNSEKDILFNVTVVETNPNVNYNVNTMHLINETRFNYNRFANAGIETGINEHIVFCNNDLEFKPGWASELLKWNFDSMSPLSLTSPTQSKFVNKQPQFGYEIAQHISGWCIYLKRSVWNMLGGLNEEFDFWFADNIYAQQLKNNKIDHFLIPKSIVNHLEGGSTTLKELDTILKEELTFKQARKYNKKFGTNHFNLNNNKN